MRASILVINGHPDPGPQRFCAAISDRYAQSIRQTGAKASRLDAGDWSLTGAGEFADGARQALSAAREAFAVADRIAVIFPLWLGEAPVSLRALLDAVCAASPGVRTIKAIRIIVTMDLPAFFYAANDRASGSRCNLRTARLPHIVDEQHCFIGSVGSLSEDGRKRWLDRVAVDAVRDVERTQRAMRRAAWSRRLAHPLGGWAVSIPERRFQSEQVAQI